MSNYTRQQERKSHIEQKNNEIPVRYEGDIRRFLEYCVATDQPDCIESMLDYLYVSLKDQRIKKNTWERRLAAIRKHLSVSCGALFDKEKEVARELGAMRKIYHDAEFLELTKVEGQPVADKQELIVLIEKLPVREKAIALINLITANRPSEMVRLKIENFDLEGRAVSIYLKKQGTWHDKRLTQEAVKAVREYIKAFKLKPSDYFVGRVYKGGRYESVKISEIGYTKAMRRYLSHNPYTLRKTQISDMHKTGADIPTISKQVGIKCKQTLVNHYLTVADSTVDKFI
ncbi:integrase/recombinase XerC [Psychrobacillus insolitus]|uniref:Integrase/recombinase XerC n=1 Tax=Psychrobacillus insolitus TaxID=1461 RepID=A0A2W7MKR7_9BACI|nr:tyrosine-type recombinase/integrase [Psychrobacillus insolitus]PZX07932.1 integrase/recombinase XerC [Psychrobacillus insolitus]